MVRVGDILNLLIGKDKEAEIESDVDYPGKKNGV